MKRTIKIIALALSILMVFALAGCAPGNTASVATLTPPDETSGAETKETAQSEVEDDLEGLCEYLEGNYCITGDKVGMSYDVIGAVNGYKYSFKYNSGQVSVEMYEFDLENLNADGKKCLEEIEQDGKFTVLEKQVDAILSKSGKYIMIYTNAATDELSTVLKEKTTELFINFKS